MHTPRYLSRLAAACLLLLALCLPGFADEPKLKALIIAGRNNHDWHRTTAMLKATLEASGRFTVDISEAPADYEVERPRETKDMTDAQKAEIVKKQAEWTVARSAYEEAQKPDWDTWRPDFSKYAVVINNYNGSDWPQPVKDAFVAYVKNGGGVLNIHAANNSFAGWADFNAMLGLGWRGASFGKRVVVDPQTNQAVEIEPGQEVEKVRNGTGHGSVHPFVVIHRDPSHPILKGLPEAWMHGADELYHGQRGSLKDLRVLASAYSDPKAGGTGEHEPVLWWVPFGKGRVVTTSLGHLWRNQTQLDAYECIGFQTIVARSAEWAATGAVSIFVPDMFPSAYRVSLAAADKVKWQGAAASIKTYTKGEIRFPPLSPEESRKLIELPPGYHAELVASEPAINEPVWAAWDGDGAMYVLEMNSYMQDVHGTGTKEARNGRIKKLVSTKNDGIYDKVTIFADGLLLPRMILPLDNRVLVQETDDESLWVYEDTKGDGVADRKELVVPGNKRSNSVEHQDSALTWNFDNWMYTAQGGERFRIKKGKWEKERVLGEFNQWGLGVDDWGNMYFSQNEIPGRDFQQPWDELNLIGERNKWARFTRPKLGPDTDGAFQRVYRIFPVGDRGETPEANYTSACGVSIYRGDALPPDTYGDMFICEPCGHLVRRGKVEIDAQGKRTIHNFYDRSEFFASRDFYTRPVITHTGPDGCLYVVDMYRGIIQDSPWVSGGFIQRIQDMGMDKVLNRGRIYRIVHDSHKPVAAPKMLKMPTVDLVQQLAHPNSWVRETAQKLLVLRGDQTAIAPLQAMARTNAAPMARVHALWTLEGLDALDPSMLREKLADTDPRVRAADLKMHEPALKQNDPAALAEIAPLAQDPDPLVRRQLILSAGWSTTPEALQLIQQIAEANIGNEIIQLATLTALYGKDDLPFVAKVLDGSAFRGIADATERTEVQRRWKAGIEAWKGSVTAPRKLKKDEVALLDQGATIYAQLCSSCHGPDGKGLIPPGQPAPLAPPLIGAKFLLGPKEAPIRVLLHGLTGDIDGKSYPTGLMAPLGQPQDDQWVAAVLSYVRGEWSNNASLIKPSDVAKIRALDKAHATPWTLAELGRFNAPLLTDRAGWKATASVDVPQNAIDGIRDSSHQHAWHGSNNPGCWLAVDLGKPYLLTHFIMDAVEPEYYPRRYKVELSDDGNTWREVDTGIGERIETLVSFEPQLARHIRITQTGNDYPRWMVGELWIHGAPADPTTAAQ
jgi:putative membrane-bound dehydrogenase-like protein